MSDEQMSAAERTHEGSSGVIDQHINAANVAENNIHLLNYQAKSVDFICNKLQEQKKVLLADEVGLGKTIIAKGVVARLARQHWENLKKHQQEPRPFRVAYLCPNQNVANQNNPKFRNMFPDKQIAQNEKKRERLENLLSEESLKEQAKKLKLTANQLTYILKPEGTVYTRLCRWLIGIYSGKTLQETMTDVERAYYLPDEEHKRSSVNINSEKGEGSNSAKGTDGTRNWAKKHMEAVLKIANSSVLTAFWNKYKESLPSSEKYYEFNCLVVAYLTSQIEQDYRLSMQHLYAAESSQVNLGNTVQFESLTPKTSFDIGKGLGTYQERALIFATLAVWKKPPIPTWLNDLMSLESERVKDYQAAYDNYVRRLNLLNLDVIENMVPQTLKDTFNSSKTTSENDQTPDDKRFIKEARRAFIENNVEQFMDYDLVIMDEFQNFSELIGCGSQEKFEAYKIASALLNKKNCKVLLLSATPFSVENVIVDTEEPDEMENSVDERGTLSENTFDHFKKLIHFMIDSEPDAPDAEVWFKDWNENRKNPKNCRELMHQIGIFRTERNAATLHSPVIEQDLAKNLAPDFTRRIQTNLFMKKDKNYIGAYGDSTPYPLVFGAGYQFSGKGNRLPAVLGDYYSDEALKELQSRLQTEIQNARSETAQKTAEEKLQSVEDKIGKTIPLPADKQMFLTENDLSGQVPLDTGHARFEALKHDLLKVSETGISTASMLWVPPCHPSNELGGAFAGRKGFSKTLIFSHYQMTPMAFTYLLCNEAGAQIGQHADQNKSEVFFHIDLKKGQPSAIVIQKEEVTASEDNQPYAKTAKAFSMYFTHLFSHPVGIAAVRSVYRDGDYLKAVQSYCDDGCLGDVLTEYTSLLAAELNDSDVRMAQAVKKVDALRISEPKLNLQEGEQLKPQKISAANLFAVGLFAENQNSSDLVIRMANIKNAFNSPFWPFVFTSTSIGAEGIDLHWYARNIVHWNAPARPLDIEQREGRVLRYRCHALRLNERLQGVVEQACVKDDWIGSDMFGTQLNFSADTEGEGDTACYHVIRKTCFESESGERDWFEHGKKIVAVYRSVLGTSDADQLLRGEVAVEDTKPAGLDLSPWSAHQEQTRSAQSNSETIV